MAKKTGDATPLSRVLGFLIWLTGVLVALAVGFAMIDGVLAIRWIPLGFTEFFGWVVIVTTLLGILLAITRRFE